MWPQAPHRLSHNPNSGTKGRHRVMYRVYEGGTAREECDLTALRQSCHAYDLWIDLSSGAIQERTKGDVVLTKKRMLGRLLLFLMVNAGKPYPPDELFEAVWGREVLGLSEGIAVRTSISRLRSLIEPAPPAWRYIMKTETSFWSPVGSYYFESGSNYCLITPRTFALPVL